MADALIASGKFIFSRIIRVRRDLSLRQCHGISRNESLTVTMMRNFLIPVLLLLPIAAQAAAELPCDERVRAGEVVKVPYPGYHGFIRTFLPREAPPDGKLPVIVHYHGYSDRLEPHLRIARAITAERYFLLVGMDYGSAEFYEDLERRKLDEEVTRLHSLIDWLEQCLPIDREEIYLSGYSQGAFAISLVGERSLDLVDGLIYLGGGRSAGEDNLPREELLEGLPVFIGFGTDDAVYGEVAEVTGNVYALLGAKVTKETWPGLDHTEGFSWYMQDPANVVNINNWLLDNTFFDSQADE